MSTPLHEFLIEATRKAAADLEAAYRRLPEDKRHVSPGGSARTPADMIAECAIMNDISGILATHVFPADFDYAAFCRLKDEVVKDEAAMFVQFHASVEKAIAAIPTVPESDLTIEIPMPWGPYTVRQVMAYPSWNMSYHEAQIIYIAALHNLDH